MDRLFNSKTSRIPPIRRDLQIIPVEDNGRELLVFYDSMKLVKQGFALDRSVEPILSLIDGRKSIEELTTYFGNGADKEQILNFIRMLDQELLLESEFYRSESEQLERDFESAGIREPALAGASYPADPAECSAFVDNILSKAGDQQSMVQRSMGKNSPKALYAPHIDLRVGGKQYGEAFSLLKNIEPERVVILATSHYSGYHPTLYDGLPFIGSTKSYKLPGRLLKADQPSVEALSEKGADIGFTTRDRANRIEHSIETHLLFASHLWTHDFQIVPVLVSGIDELFYMRDGDMAKKIAAFADALREQDTDETFYLISGDLSHVGKKFGDPVPASTMRSDVEAFDQRFIDIAAAGNEASMVEHMAENYDPFRICGFPPLYTFIKMFPELEGRTLNYHWWDESERESAVSFGSILY